MKQYKVVPSTRFQKDLKLAARRRCNIQQLREVVKMLAAGETLDQRYRDHALGGGEYARCRECHINPDWLLVYRYIEDELLLYLVRTGSHSDLF